MVLTKARTPTETDACMGDVVTELDTGDGGDVVGSCCLLLGH